MCGIAGVVSLQGPLSEAEHGLVRSMASALRHRGPDHTGFFDSARVCFGNTRLKVVDVSDRANLPMLSDDGATALCYNGEITNFSALVREFSLGEKFRLRSRSDSEVLLRLFELQGPACLKHLNGMFAFAVFDGARDRVFLVRDHFGTRPVFYLRTAGRLYFASELKAFFELPVFFPRLNPEAVYHFLTLGYIPGSLTPYEGVSELRPGCLLEIDLVSGAVRGEEYFFRPEPPPLACGEKEAARLVLEALSDSVARNMVADVPVGVNLSGGLDSSAIAALVRRTGHRGELHAFCLRVDSPTFDESPFQTLMAEREGCLLHSVRVGPEEILGALRRHMAYLDEPSANGAVIPSFLLAREASRYVRVLLSGEGGDEVFYAYDTYVACRARLAYRSWAPRALRAALSRAVGALPVSHDKLSLDFRLKRFAAGCELDDLGSHLYWRHAVGDEDKARLMPDLFSRLGPTAGFFRTEFDRLPPESDLVERLARTDVRYYFVDDLMVKHDRMSMAHGLEARFPYMDRRVTELAAALPVRMKLRGLFGRRRIQKLALSGVVPDVILRRRKMGLEIPYSAWLAGPLRPAAEKYFSEKSVERCGLLAPRAVAELWREHLERRRDNGRALWGLLSFFVWHELFVASRDYRRYLEAAES